MNALGVVLGLLLAVAAASRGAWDRQPVAPTPTTLPATVARIEERLASLTPSEPREYFLLAEELGSESADRPSRDLARTLYVLSFELFRTRNQPGDGEWARSSAIGLASLSRVEGERRWLAAVGDQVAPVTDGASTASARMPPPVPEAVALNLATAMGLARSGEGRRAEQYLSREGVRELLAATQSVVAGAARANDPVSRWVEDWPVCPTCKNRRIVTRGSESKLCPYCDGNPGPKLNDAELLTQYRAESLVLRGAYRSWSAQLLADDGEPLRDPNPGDVAPSFGVDPRATLWRSGGWVSP